MNDKTMVASDLYLRRIDKDGHVTVTHHRVWDSTRFYESECQAAAKVDGAVFHSDHNEWQEANKPARL